MDILEGIKVGLFVISLVFALLAVLYALIKLATAAIQRYFSKA